MWRTNSFDILNQICVIHAIHLFLYLYELEEKLPLEVIISHPLQRAFAKATKSISIRDVIYGDSFSVAPQGRKT